MTSTIEITTCREFEETVRKGIRLVLFTASWSRPCQEQCRNVRRIGKDFSGVVQVVLVDVDKCPSIAADAVIQTIPTCVIYRDREEILRLVGLQREKVLCSIIKNDLSGRYGFRKQKGDSTGDMPRRKSNGKMRKSS